jgi:hypothetical protein
MQFKSPPMLENNRCPFSHHHHINFLAFIHSAESISAWTRRSPQANFSLEPHLLTARLLHTHTHPTHTHTHGRRIVHSARLMQTQYLNGMPILVRGQSLRLLAAVSTGRSTLHWSFIKISPSPAFRFHSPVQCQNQFCTSIDRSTEAQRFTTSHYDKFTESKF